MVKPSPWSRYLPALGVMLALVLAAAAVVLWLEREPRQSGGAAVDTLGRLVAAAQTARSAAARALDGDTGALDTLRRSAARLGEHRAELRGAGGPSARLARGAALDDLESGVAALLEHEAALERVDAARTELMATAADLPVAAGNLASTLTPAELEANQVYLDRLELMSERVTLAAGALPAGGPAAVERLGDAADYVERVVRGLSGRDSNLGVTSVADRAAAGSLEAAGAALEQMRRAVGTLASAAGALEAAGAALATIDRAAGDVVAAYGEIDAPAAASGTAAGLPDVAGASLGLVLVLAALAIAALMMLAYYRARDFRRAAEIQAEQNERNQQAILRLLDELSNLADGDLTVQATVTEDITGAIADSINYAIEALRDLVITVNESAILVDGASKQTEGTSQHLLRTSETQSKQAAAASDSIGQMVASVEEVSGNAERCADVAHHAVDVAHKGGEAVRRTIEGMNAIRETIQDTSKRIKRLGESSQEIGNIVELIEEIAEQTNILALNASIEASRAGESSRGFAVVADEVQKLAERSANATRKIEVLVSTIQSDTNEAVISMERSTTDVVGGALLAENAGAALDEIEQVSHQIASLVQNISSSARDQSKVAGAINKNMQVLRQISAKSRESSAATSSAISKLAELASQLRTTVSGFKLPSAPGGTGVLNEARLAASLEQVSDTLPGERDLLPPEPEQRRRQSG